MNEENKPMADKWVLMKRGLYYRPDAKGYTGNINEAWVVTEEEANRHVYPHDEPVTKHRCAERKEGVPNPLDLERVKAYCAKATAGPWLYRNVHNPSEETPSLYTDAIMYGLSGPHPITTSGPFLSGNDFDFIAQSRTDLPAAVAEIERLRAACLLLLDHVDYTAGACVLTEPVGAVLPHCIMSAIDRLIQRTSRYAPELADEAQAELATLRAELDAAQRDKRVIQEHLNQNTISQAGQITALRAENLRLKGESEIAKDQIANYQMTGGNSHKEANEAATEWCRILGIDQDIWNYWRDFTPHLQALKTSRDTYREIAGELGKASEPFKQMADKFDDPRYRDQWPDETRLSGDGIGVLRNNTIQLHNFLTLGDCRKLKAVLARWTAIEKGKG